MIQMRIGMNYKIIFTKTASKDMKLLCRSKLDVIAKRLIDKISIDPFCYPPSYEKLIFKYKMYSRRINKQHRLVYMVNEKNKEIYIIRMWTHYDNV